MDMFERINFISAVRLLESASGHVMKHMSAGELTQLEAACSTIRHEIDAEWNRRNGPERKPYPSMKANGVDLQKTMGNE